MNKTRLTTEITTHDMNTVELALNSAYIDADKNVRYRDYDRDVDARQLTVKLLDVLADTPNEFISDEDFDMYMAELLSDPIDSIDGLIALFYRNLWAMAELRERLKEYEDTGLSPEDIEKLKER